MADVRLALNAAVDYRLIKVNGGVSLEHKLLDEVERIAPRRGCFEIDESSSTTNQQVCWNI